MTGIQPYTQSPPFHSQWGEDRWLAEHFCVPSTGVFVDIGAGDGIRGSNSLYFETLGWQGLCVDPDPRNANVLRRRNCAVEACAVSSEPGFRPFGMYRHKPSWSGLQRRGDDYIQIIVHCERLDTLLARHAVGHIDLLSIDVEGSELDVWNSFDSSLHQPSVVIIEFDDRHMERAAAVIHRQIGTDSYDLVHSTPANLIFTHRTRRWASQ